MESKYKELKNIEDIKTFIFGGNATVTLKSVVTGKWFTFKIRKSKKDEQSPFFVSLLTGPDNFSNYSYVGIINSDKNTFKLTQKSKVSSDAISYKAFNFFFKQLLTNKIHPDLKVYHSGKCGRCGKKLTTPESIERGMGKSCFSKS